MMIKLKIILLINCFLIYFVLSEKPAKSCSMQELNNNNNNICPINTKCKQKEGDIGDCQCDDNYYFNKLYLNDSDYCLIMNVTITSTSAPIIIFNKTVTVAPIIVATTTTTVTPLITKVTTIIVAPPTISTIPTTVKPESTSSSSTSSTIATILDKKIPDNTPGGHHVASGILIPIFIVLIIIGNVYIVQKYNLITKFRDYIITRRHRPFYEDVMMGNDLDDPLLT